MRYLLITLLILSMFLISGCIKCDSPYIQVGEECCLDSNANRICDKDDCLDSNSNDVCDSDEYKCSDGTLVSNENECKKEYCEMISKPAATIECQTKVEKGYDHCIVKITPSTENNDDLWISYLMYSSVSGTNKRDLVYGNYNFNPCWTGPIIPADIVDSNIFYFDSLYPENVISNMFYVIPYDVLNKKNCTTLETSILFDDAVINPYIAWC